MITAYATTETAIEAMKLGAYDYLTKPFKLDEIKLIIDKALERKRLQRENLALRRSSTTRAGFENSSARAGDARVFETIRKTADAHHRAHHRRERHRQGAGGARDPQRRRARRDGPFVAVNCGAIPES